MSDGVVLRNTTTAGRRRSDAYERIAEGCTVLERRSTARAGCSQWTPPPRAPHRGGLDVFRRGWETQVGDDVFQLPAFSSDTIGDFRVKGNVAKVHGAAIADLHAASATRTADVPGGDQDLVAMYVVRRGAWTLGGPPGYGDRTVSAGQFLVRHLGSLTAFETSAHLTAKFLVLPPVSSSPCSGPEASPGRRTRPRCAC